MKNALTWIVLSLLIGAGSAAVAGAQLGSVAMGPSDIQRLQDGVLDASGEISRLRARDAQLAARLQDELDDLRDEVTYLRVKSRKEAVSWSEYKDLRDRIEDLRMRARGERAQTGSPAERAPVASPPPSAPQPAPPPAQAMDTRRANEGELPVGQQLDVRLQTRLNSGTAQVEDRIETTTLVDLYQGETLLVPAGSLVRGVVAAVDRAGRVDRKASLTLSFDEIVVRGVAHKIRATVVGTIESEGIRGEATKIGVGSGVGMILGGLLGGVKGAIAGILLGGGGALMASEGKEVDLPAGSVLRVRLDSPVQIARR
jgi:TolA-binding protein